MYFQLCFCSWFIKKLKKVNLYIFQFLEKKCITVGGQDPYKECTLPFNLTEIFTGRKEFNTCALDNSGRAFCSAGSDWSPDISFYNRSSKIGRNTWGYCSDSCPMPEPTHGNTDRYIILIVDWIILK